MSGICPPTPPHAGTSGWKSSPPPGKGGTGDDGNNNRKPSPARSVSPDSSCPICLGSLKDRAFTDACAHQFCFGCIKEWSAVKPECPLCKKRFKEIRHNAHLQNERRSARLYDTYHLPTRTVPQYSLPEYRDLLADMHNLPIQASFNVSWGNMRVNQAMHALIGHNRHRDRTTGRANTPRRNSVDFRRLVYARCAFCTGVNGAANNSPSCLSAAYYRGHAASVHRLRLWLRRESGAIYPNDSVGASHLLFSTVDLLTELGLDNEEAVVRSVHPYLRTRTRQFINEMLAFARVDPMTMHDWDLAAQYPTLGDILASSNRATVSSNRSTRSSSRPAHASGVSEYSSDPMWHVPESRGSVSFYPPSMPRWPAVSSTNHGPPRRREPITARMSAGNGIARNETSGYSDEVVVISDSESDVEILHMSSSSSSDMSSDDEEAIINIAPASTSTVVSSAPACLIASGSNVISSSRTACPVVSGSMDESDDDVVLVSEERPYDQRSPVLLLSTDDEDEPSTAGATTALKVSPKKESSFETGHNNEDEGDPNTSQARGLSTTESTIKHAGPSEAVSRNRNNIFLPGTPSPERLTGFLEVAVALQSQRGKSKNKDRQWLAPPSLTIGERSRRLRRETGDILQHNQNECRSDGSHGEKNRHRSRDRDCSDRHRSSESHRSSERHREKSRHRSSERHRSRGLNSSEARRDGGHSHDRERRHAREPQQDGESLAEGIEYRPKERQSRRRHRASIFRHSPHRSRSRKLSRSPTLFARGHQKEPGVLSPSRIRSSRGARASVHAHSYPDTHHNDQEMSTARVRETFERLDKCESRLSTIRSDTDVGDNSNSGVNDGLRSTLEEINQRIKRRSMTKALDTSGCGSQRMSHLSHRLANRLPNRARDSDGPLLITIPNHAQPQCQGDRNAVGSSSRRRRREEEEDERLPKKRRKHRSKRVKNITKRRDKTTNKMAGLQRSSDASGMLVGGGTPGENIEMCFSFLDKSTAESVSNPLDAQTPAGDSGGEVASDTPHELPATSGDVLTYSSAEQVTLPSRAVSFLGTDDVILIDSSESGEDEPKPGPSGIQDRRDFTVSLLHSDDDDDDFLDYDPSTPIVIVKRKQTTPQTGSKKHSYGHKRATPKQE